ncbi:MAG TPA: glycosyltransferase family 39 protein [Anaerolineae bacterium]
MRHTWLAGLVLILLLATFLRLHRLETQSLWNDEGNSARLSERSIPLIIEGTASDIHPPLYYLLLHGWRELLGASEFSLRAVSAFSGIATVAVTFTLARTVTGYPSPVIAAVAALLAAVSPALVYYSQEARMYSLLGFLATLATLLLIRWWQATLAARSTLILVVVYVLCVVAGLYTHYFFPAVLLAHNLIVLVWLIRGARLRSNHLVISWVVMMSTTVLLYLPWLPTFLEQSGSDPTGRPPFLDFLAASVRWLAFGATVKPDTIYWSLLAVALLLGGGVLAGYRGAVVGVVTGAVPLLVMFAAGLVRPEFYKFLVVAVPPFCLLLARALALQPKLIPWFRPLLSLLFLMVLWGSGRSLQNLYANPLYARADYRQIAAHIMAEAHPNAGIILDAPNQWEVFTYYYPKESFVYPLPKGRQRPDPAVISAELSDIAARHDRLYAVFWGEAQRDPERLVERWLDEHAFKATDEWVGDVRFVTYAVPANPADEMETAVNLEFGEHIHLKGYTLLTDEVAAGDILQLTLFWETTTRLDWRYKVFLHLLDENGQVVAQRDSEPGGSLIPTTIWQPGQTIIDNHGILLPATTPPGQYRLIVGLYDFADPSARLPIRTSAGVVSAFPLATIRVVP